MIMKKKWVGFLILICTVCYLWIFIDLEVSAKENGLKEFGVQVTNVFNSYTYSVNWWQKQESPVKNEYYMTLPYSAKGQLLMADISGNADVFLNGEEIKNGSIIDCLFEGENQRERILIFEII